MGLSTGRNPAGAAVPSVRQVDKTIPLVDGLRLIERTDEAGSGEVWRARITGGLAGARGDPLPGELSGVGECVVRLLRLPVDEALRGRARALADDLVALDDPGLVTIRSVVSAYDGIALIFAPLPSPMPPLHLLARRRQLLAGEVVTLGVALAWALAAAHRFGVAHGRLRDADVLLDEGGRPVLAGVGVMGVLGAPGTPAADVGALGRLLGSLLDGASGGADRVLAVLGDRSLTATELAARLAAATAACPIVMSDPDPAAPAACVSGHPRAPPAARIELERLEISPSARRRADAWCDRGPGTCGPDRVGERFGSCGWRGSGAAGWATRGSQCGGD